MMKLSELIRAAADIVARAENRFADKMNEVRPPMIISSAVFIPHYPGISGLYVAKKTMSPHETGSIEKIETIRYVAVRIRTDSPHACYNLEVRKGYLPDFLVSHPISERPSRIAVLDLKSVVRGLIYLDKHTENRRWDDGSWRRYRPSIVSVANLNAVASRYGIGPELSEDAYKYLAPYVPHLPQPTHRVRQRSSALNAS